VGYSLFLTGLIRAFPHFLGLPYPFMYLIGPAFYFFMQLALQPNFILRKRHLWHLLPFVVIALRYVPFLLRSGEEKLLIIDRIMNKEWEYTWSDLILDNSVIFYIMVYTMAAFRLARLTEFRQREPANRQNARWLRNFSFLFLSLLVANLAIQFIFFSLGLDATQFEYVLVALFAIAFHFLGYHILRDLPEIPQVSIIRSPEKYRYSPLNHQQLVHYEKQLISVMKDKRPFLDPELRQATLANYLGISTAYLSQLLNEQMNTTFYEFVNGYRIETVKKRLQQKEFAQYTLLAIGLDAGFANKTSFNRTFKKFTGMTPSQFAKQFS
jgi:AraC-like DNA-binding protein